MFNQLRSVQAAAMPSSGLTRPTLSAMNEIGITWSSAQYSAKPSMIISKRETR